LLPSVAWLQGRETVVKAKRNALRAKLFGMNTKSSVRSSRLTHNPHLGDG
jgi:hypothetical protein